MLKREWGAENNGKLPHLFIPSKTATLVPEFAEEGLQLGRTAALVPEFVMKDCPWAERSDNDKTRQRLRGASGYKLASHRARVPRSRLGHSMWVSWWKKRSLDRFFSEFPPSTNSIPQFLHTDLILSFNFISSAPVMMRQAWSADILTIHSPLTQGLHCISSRDPALCRTRIENHKIFLNMRQI